MLGKSLSNSEGLIRMENAPERGVWNHRLQLQSADLREKHTARARQEGRAQIVLEKGEAAILGIQREMRGKGRG